MQKFAEKHTWTMRLQFGLPRGVFFIYSSVFSPMLRPSPGFFSTGGSNGLFWQTLQTAMHAYRVCLLNFTRITTARNCHSTVAPVGFNLHKWSSYPHPGHQRWCPVPPLPRLLNPQPDEQTARIIREVKDMVRHYVGSYYDIRDNVSAYGGIYFDPGLCLAPAYSFGMDSNF